LLQQETPIMSAANYFAQEHLRDGRPVKIRALRPDDKTSMLAAIDRTGTESLKRRFFVTKRKFSDMETAFFMNVDFADHVALVAEIKRRRQGRDRWRRSLRRCRIRPSRDSVHRHRFISAARNRSDPGPSHRGVSSCCRTEAIVGRCAAENVAMLTVLGKFGFRTRGMDPHVVHLTLPLVQQI
jgi:hypothetical protein